MKKIKSQLTQPILGVVALLVLAACRVEATPGIGYMNVGLSKFLTINRTDLALTSTATGIGTWEVFDKHDLGGGKFSLLAHGNGKYVRVINTTGYPVVADSTSVGTWETFTATNRGWRAANGLYVTAISGTTHALYATAVSVGPNEGFSGAPCDLDIWMAVSAFADNYPNKVKLGPPGSMPVSTERMDNPSVHRWYQLYADYRWSPIGAPCWDKNSLRYIGGWETYVCYNTILQFSEGTFWDVGIPRTRRYCQSNIQEDSPGQAVNWSNLNHTNCSIYNPHAGTEWGRRYPTYMMDLSNASSQVNMGNRWVVDVGYKDFGEKWTFDLGPSVGVFSPKFGIVRYRNGRNLDATMNNIQDWQQVYNPICGY
jgi:hypothetical protein